jgi:hypothetical protein
MNRYYCTAIWSTQSDEIIQKMKTRLRRSRVVEEQLNDEDITMDIT